MKKTLKLFLITLIIGLLVSCKETGNTIDNLIFEDVVINEEVVAYKIVGHGNKLPKNITIPKTFSTSVNGTKPVTIIGANAFRSSNVVSVTIPESITLIEEEAFLNSRKLEKITFEGLSNVTEIGNNAFRYAVNLKSINIPKSVKRIGEFAFFEAISLNKVTFEDESLLEVIGNNAFSKTNLTEFTVPEKVKTIEMPLFYDSNKLKNIYVDPTNKNFVSVSGVLYSYDKTVLISYPNGKNDKSYILLEETLIIGNRAFYSNKHLEEVILNESLQQINDLAFARTEKLKTLVFGESLLVIKKDAFKEAKDLVLFFSFTEEKVDFHNGWNSSSLKVYYKPNWHFDNGVPTPNNS